MRKRNIHKLISSFLLGLMLSASSSSSSYAFFNIFSAANVPVVDGLNIAMAGGKAITGALNEVTNAQAWVMDQYNKAKKSITKTLSGKFKGGAKKDAVTAVRKIADSKIADEKSEASVKKAIYTLFFLYPSADVIEQKAYKDMVIPFYNDTIIEAYAAVRELDKEIPAIEEQIELTASTLVDGGEDSCEANDENCAWSNNYKANQSIDNLVFILQELTAIKMQMSSARAIRDNVEPIYMNDKEASLHNDNLKIASSAKYSSHDSLAFAQAFFQTQDSQHAAGSLNSGGAKASATGSVASKNPLADIASFAVAPEPELVYSPFKENEDKLQEIAKLDPVDKDTKIAIEIHNMVKGLKNYKENVMRFNQISRMHAKAVETLQLSEQCTIDFLGRHYSNPVTAWSGRPMGSQVNQHDLRGGISGWAIKAFEVAKSENLSPISVDDVETNIETGADGNTVAGGNLGNIKDSSNLTDMKNQADNFDYSTNSLKDKSQAEDIEKNAREVDLISWQIGAQAMKKLEMNPSEWNAGSGGFPVWEDQKSMMNQYYDGKYNNIVQYIENMDTQPVVNKISSALSSDKEAYDKAEEERIKASAKNEIIAKMQIQASKEESSRRFFARLNKAKSDIDAIRAAMVQLVKNAREQIAGLGTTGVTKSGQPAVLNIHNQMMMQIKALSLAVENISGSGTLMSVVLADELLSDADASADTEYFIGAQAKIRDFRGPMAAPESSFAPLREIVHYDDVDWVNSKPLSKQNFLNYGGDVPNIWKTILKDKLFVEKDIDLGAVLNVENGTPAETLYRGGRYPCRAGGVVNRIIDIDEHGRYTIRDNSSNYPKCELETITKFWKVQQLTHVERHYHIYNSKFDKTFGDVMTVDLTKCNCDGKVNLKTSELGVILNGSGNSISFRNTATGTFEDIQKAKEETDDTEETFEEKIVADAPLQINQIGDFLKVAELEIDLRNSKEELAEKIKIAKEDLNKILKLAGFEPTADFDISTDKDYNTAKEKMIKVKMSNLANAVKGINGINDGGNEVVIERVNKYKRIIRALQQDKNAVTMLSDNPPTESELAEQIKSEEVNEKVEDQYKKEANDDIENQIKNFYKPYCAVY